MTSTTNVTLDAALSAELLELDRAGLYRSLRTVATAQGPLVSVDGRDAVNFCSNDYLGLANDARLKQAATDAIDQFGVGACASRLTCGNLEPYRRLESALTTFKQKQAAIVFSSGYAANVGVISAIVGPDDVVIVDKLCHASIIDGCRQSGAVLRVYPHLNLGRLEELLAGTSAARRRLVITETVYSMDGDLAPLREMIELKDRYDAWLMVDEAHATGVFGPNGRGVAEHLGVDDRIEVVMGTLSKSLGCLGGYVAGSRVLIDYLRNKARSLVYSTALPPAVCAAAATAVSIAGAEEGRVRRDRLWRNVAELKRRLIDLGLRPAGSSAIVPVIVGDERAAVDLSRALFDRGLLVSAVRYPTVARGKARLRITATAAHTDDQIAQLATALKELWRPISDSTAATNMR